MIRNDEGLLSVEIGLDDVLRLVDEVRQQRIRAGSGAVEHKPLLVKPVPVKPVIKSKRRKKSLLKRVKSFFKHKFFKIRRAWRRYRRSCRAGGSVRYAQRRGHSPKRI